MEKLILKGVAASAGIACGVVKIVEGVKDISKFDEGNVLVAKITEPSMVIMMNKASAIVTDKGGLTSHPAIVSRELGIPCVVAAQKATQVLEDGMIVKVNGSTGEVYIIE
ncbi:MAG: PEP-utilizing enzyme [Candidatus Staskawiczbacteria bacterium]|jgi:pyruvate,water dikinase